MSCSYLRGGELKSCDYCGLEVNVSGFFFDHDEGRKFFCCEGCKSIYKLFGDIQVVKTKTPKLLENSRIREI